MLDLGRNKTFFVALPDNEAAAAVAARLVDVADVALPHPSGRPWLLARVNSGDLVEHSEGPRRLALLGSTAATSDDLEKIIAKAATPRDLAAVSRRIAGSYCVVGSLDGVVFASGPALETRRIFHAVVDGVRVVADRADVLAELGGFAVDAGALSLRLVSSLPHPCNDIAMWREVTPVPGADCITVERDGRVRSTTWWRPPAPAVSREEGANRLREAVESAVRARAAGGVAVACDLSGGLDSTPLCYFAAQGPRGVLARTLYNDDPGGREDLNWAERALESMPGVHTHLVSSMDEMADFYGGLKEMRVELDEPTQAATAAPRIRQMLVEDAELGVRMHLNGLGGDHLLRGVKNWNHRLMRTRPWQAWRRARAEDVPEGIGPLTTCKQLLDRRTYRQWFAAAVADAADGVEPPDGFRTNDWAPRPSIPAWLSADARAAVVAKLREVAATAEPYDTELATHSDMASVRDAGRLVRGTGQLGHPAGIAYEAPLLDDRVVESVLAVRREERDSPLEWKPMMKAAMRGLLPDEYLWRTSKVGGAPQSVRGYAAHFSEIVEICEESGLAGSGLIDMDRFSREAKPDAKVRPSNRVHETINAALFLRNLTTGTEAVN